MRGIITWFIWLYQGSNDTDKKGLSCANYHMRIWIHSSVTV